MQTLLIIKDDDVVSAFFKQILEEDGSYTVALARNGEIGIQLVRELSPAVIITDLFLPGMNGVAVANAIKTDPNLSHIPIIILVGEEKTKVAAKVLEGRCDLYLTKPISVQSLVSGQLR